MAEKFGPEYWRRRAEDLDVTDDVRHVQFADFVADVCGSKVRFIPGIGWHRWTGKVWAVAGGVGAAMQAITDAAIELGRYAGENGQGWALKAASKMLVNSVRKGIVEEMEYIPALRGDVDEMDSHRHLLTFQNGTVDLRTGELGPFDPDHMATQIAEVNYNPDAECPRWIQALDEFFPGDTELQEYMQTFLGMCITGEVRDHKLAVWYGEHGRNGKGTTVRAMQAAFGKELVREVDFTLYEGGRNSRPHTESLAALRNARMVTAQEGSEGAQMNTALLKKHSGGDRLVGRHLYGTEFTYSPKFTLVLCTNYLPEFSAGGTALWARTHAVLFGESFAGREDPKLEPTIQGPESEGFAAWVVRGAVDYYRRERLHTPASVAEATAHHQDEVDPLKPLVGELFEYSDEHSVKRSDFNGDLKRWREMNGDDATKFKPGFVKRRLVSKGVREERVNGVYHYVGIYLASDPPAPSAAQRADGGRIRILPTAG